jgi:dTMP kinase
MRIYAVNIRWKLWRGTTVICDRYLWDTLIDFKIMFPDVCIEKWILWKILAWCSPVPSVEYLLMIPIETSEKRCLQKYEPFPDTPERRSRRYRLYKEILNLNKWTVIDATQTAETVFVEIQHKLP